GLVREVHRHKGRRATVEALLLLARTLAIEVVAEGIETDEELATLRELGVKLGQGYLLGRPAPLMVDAVSIGRHAAGPGDNCSAIHIGVVSSDAIGRLAVLCPAVDAGAELSVAVKIFEDQRADGVVVVEGRVPRGLLMKAHVYQLLGRAYGRDLYLRRS